MAFSSLRSLTPSRRHRRRRQREHDETEKQPKDARNESPGRSMASSVSGDGSNSSVALDEEPRRTRSRRQADGEARSTLRATQQADDDEEASPPPTISDSREHRSESLRTFETDATSIHTLPALQAKGPAHDFASLEPVSEDDPASYDLVPPAAPTSVSSFSIEDRSEDIFSVEHLRTIFKDSTLLVKFTTFLGVHRPQSVPLLIYYLDALKALGAIAYSNAVADALEPLKGLDFTQEGPALTENNELEKKARQAFEVIARDDLPAFVTYTWVQVVSVSISRRITGSMPPHLRELSEGLAEVFCLTDPSREDNPIIMASEEFYRTTQYGVNYAIGRNCRFLQGPRTSRDTTKRLREAIHTGKDICETFINYRRDGSPFMNLLMMAPLRDSRGNLRYFIGAQVDVSGLAKECTELEGVQRMLARRNDETERGNEETKDEFQVLSEMFNQSELETARKFGGRMHQERVDDESDAGSTNWNRPRLLLKDPIADDKRNKHSMQSDADVGNTIHGKLLGIYENYLLVRPYPSLRILFASPSLRVPGMLQSSFMDRIGSSERVRDELVSALAEGRGVTAKVRWVNKNNGEGRNRWIHCTPLMGSNGSIGAWMIVLVDDEGSKIARRFRPAPPVATNISGDKSGKEDKRYTTSTRPESRVSQRGGNRGRNSAMGYYGRTTSAMDDESEDDLALT